MEEQGSDNFEDIKRQLKLAAALRCVADDIITINIHL